MSQKYEVQMCFRLSSSSSKLHPQGSFDENVCKSLHSINPYGSREGRIVFSTWNLDHRFTPPLVYLQDFFEGFFFALHPSYNSSICFQDWKEEDSYSRSAGSSAESQEHWHQPELLLPTPVHEGKPEAGPHRLPQKRSSQPAVWHQEDL